MKKLIASVLALILVFSLSAAAFADGGSFKPDVKVNRQTDYIDIDITGEDADFLRDNHPVFKVEGVNFSQAYVTYREKADSTNEIIDCLGTLDISAKTFSFPVSKPGYYKICSGNSPVSLSWGTGNRGLSLGAMLKISAELNIAHSCNLSEDYVVNNSGLLIFESNPGDSIALENADFISTEFDTISSNQNMTTYKVLGVGFPAKELNKTLYTVLYLVLPDGTIKYGQLIEVNNVELCSSAANKFQIGSKERTMYEAIVQYANAADAYFN